MFVCCSPDVFRKLMVQFRRADLPHEQYVFFYIDVFGDSLNSKQGQPWARGDEDDAVAKEAFQAEPDFPELLSSVSSLVSVFISFVLFGN
ncbi:Atrial natriuretic peptide receptor 1 [Collichthys lucidus]|uniref:Atrial natriuretic peptide receptor 1 n=1 Tax=Collichthys lucidus TaxID=240159 RepID=A0A4U5V5Y2_COLLU|nr:Atrial natriuretic peptide receptor 1 [Collichthys lucidus]